MKNSILILTVLALLFSCKKEEVNENNTNSEEQINHTDSKDWLNASIEYGTLTDVDGNSYATVTIGSQVWMAENLRTSKYCNGDLIANAPDSSEWFDLTSGAWAHYNNDNQFENHYGKLYNWYAVKDNRNICPCGWHVASKSEWLELINYLGGDTIAGGKMKSISTLWEQPNAGATNESGFSALPGGWRNMLHNFSNMNTILYFWSSSEEAMGAIPVTLNYSSGEVSYDFPTGKDVGASVRCIKD